MAAFRGAFTDAQWARLLSLGEQVEVEPGATVFRRGVTPGAIVVVRSGTLEALDRRASPPTVLGLFESGAVLGEIAAVDGSTASVDVRARDTSTFVRVAREVLLQALQTDVELDRAFHRGAAQLLADRMRVLTDTAVDGAIGSRAGDLQTPEPPLELPGVLRSRVQQGIDPHIASALEDQARGRFTVPLDRERIVIGSHPGEADLVLPDLRIEPIHAELVRSEGGWRIVSDADRPVVVRQAPVSSAPVIEGEPLLVGGYTLTIEGEELVVTPCADVHVLRVERLSQVLGGRTILERIDFAALSGEVIGVVGPSGSGKSTLLSALRGPRTSGSVRLDQHALDELLIGHPSLFGDVPQDDIVYSELTVEESLDASARLRLPALRRAERAGVVNHVIELIGLDDVRSSRIGDPARRGISGGQRKRVNMASELLADDTTILFLDEPTSGLDPRSTADILGLARRLADLGNIVFVVTHDLSSSVIAQMDHLMVLVDGHQAWFGPPDQATAHFDVRRPVQIFRRLPDHTGEDWSQRYRETEAYRTWVQHRIEPPTTEAALVTTPIPPAPRPPSWLEQLWVFTGRHARVRLRDTAGVAVWMAQPMLVAAVVMLVFPQATAGLVFLVVLSSFWFGMSSSVRDLIADLGIWRREQRLGLSPMVWVASKALVAGVAVALQSAALAAVAWWGHHLGALGFPLAPWIGTAILTSWAGMGAGLFASAFWRRSEAAIGSIVLFLVPQIAFSGLLMPLNQLQPVAQWIAWFTPVRYAYHLALVSGDHLRYLRLGEWYSRPVSGELFLMGLRPAGEGSLGLGAGWLVLALGGWIVLCLVSAVVLVRHPRR